ncbi:MAG: CapA family protein [Akkermansiaceae bacterium]|nr:CapA family protein [Akkermansiaceae bacterium]
MNVPSMPMVKAAFTGDVALGGAYLEKARPADAAMTYPFTSLAPLWDDLDLLVVNLEGPIGTAGTKRGGQATLLHNHPDILEWMEQFPCCVCSLANNHAMDFGGEALAKTRETLEARGIHCVGAGRDAREAGKALRVEVRGLAVGFLAFTTAERHVGSVLASDHGPGSCGWPGIEAARTRVASLAREVDAVVVMLHWGHEYFHYPSPEQVAWCRERAAAGASLVIGHHPHVPQGHEMAGDTLICHSLGNLILPETKAANERIQYRKPATKEFAVLKADLTRGKVAAWRVVGGRCNRRYELRPYAGRAADQFSRRLSGLSDPLRQTDYRGFWESYASRRRRQLSVESIRDAAVKMARTDFRTLLRTLSFEDLKRNAGRLAGMLSPGHRAATAGAREEDRSPAPVPSEKR